jgi:hypothetical protein
MVLISSYLLPKSTLSLSYDEKLSSDALSLFLSTSGARVPGAIHNRSPIFKDAGPRPTYPSFVAKSLHIPCTPA